MCASILSWPVWTSLQPYQPVMATSPKRRFFPFGWRDSCSHVTFRGFTWIVWVMLCGRCGTTRARDELPLCRRCRGRSDNEGHASGRWGAWNARVVVKMELGNLAPRPLILLLPYQFSFFPAHNLLPCDFLLSIIMMNVNDLCNIVMSIALFVQGGGQVLIASKHGLDFVPIIQRRNESVSKCRSCCCIIVVYVLKTFLLSHKLLICEGKPDGSNTASWWIWVF